MRACIQSWDIARFLPPENRSFARLIEDGLAYFVGRIGERRVAELLTEQQSLANSPPVMRLVAMLHQSPTLHKLGQMVARDRRLSPALRRQLTTLESLSPSTPMPQIAEVLRDEWSDVERATVQLAAAPLAEASVAVVVPFVHHNGASQTRGVAKVLRPGVEDRLTEELPILRELGEFLDDRRTAYGLGDADFREPLERAAELLANEVRPDREQAHLLAAAESYRNNRDVVVPKLYAPLCTTRVTAMAFVEGTLIAQVAEAGGETARRAARRVVDALIARPLFSDEPDAIVHGDPHAGNLLMTPCGRLGLIDWSLTGRLSKHHREAVVQMIVAAAIGDAGGIARSISSLSVSEPDESSLRREVGIALSSLRGMTPGISWVTALLDRAALHARVRFDDRLLLFRKSILTVQGVVADLDPDCSIDTLLHAEVGIRLVQEWPRRWMSAPSSRAFSTHLSNADLGKLIWSACTSWTRCFPAFAQQRGES